MPPITSTSGYNIQKYRGDQGARLWDEVLDELFVMVSLSVYYGTFLGSEWREWIFMTDASYMGFGIVASRSDVEEMRRLCEGVDEQGWSTQLHEAYSGVEEDEFDAATPAWQHRAREKEALGARKEAPGFCELFAGSARLSAAVGRARLSWVEPWEITQGPRYDLGDLSNLGRLFVDLARCIYWLVHLAPPCSAWSRARVPRLRSAAEPWGLSGLSAAERELADDGTYLMMIAVEVMLECVRREVPFSMENPASSMCWQSPR